jgi:predicted site-specific integrase-resolvase
VLTFFILDFIYSIIAIMNDLSLFKQFAPEAPHAFKEGNNAVIYTRVSSADQEDNTSLASQKKH